MPIERIRKYLIHHPLPIETRGRGPTRSLTPSDEGEPDRLPGEILLDFAAEISIGDAYERIVGPVSEIIGEAEFALETEPAPGSEKSRFFSLGFAADPEGDPDLFAAIAFDFADLLLDIESVAGAEPDLEILPQNGFSSFLDDEPGADSKASDGFYDGWHHKEIFLQQAWDLMGSGYDQDFGRTITIGHPDTGFADHREVNGPQTLQHLSFDTINNRAPGIDPLSGLNPGHGDATSSVLASPVKDGFVVQGAAPGARFIPYRAARQIVVFPRQRPLARAIRRAIDDNVDIISMSLGGLPISVAGAVIEEAVDRNILVLAAAGNVVPWVVYPAADRNVIAVAGSAPGMGIWKGSSYGPQVDLSAPARKVLCASHKSGAPDQTNLGKGTSFAVALTAGAGALWLERLGKAALIEISQATGFSVQEIFRLALRKSCTTPPRWPTSDYGVGILNVEKLLSTGTVSGPIAPTPRKTTSPSGRAGLRGLWQTYRQAHAQLRGRVPENRPDRF